MASYCLVMVKKGCERGLEARRKCPLFGVLCFVCAFVSSFFGAETASADTPPAAIKTTPLAAPAAVLGMSNPYIVAAAVNKPQPKAAPKAIRFTFSRDLIDFAHRVELLAREGIVLNQRKTTSAEKLNLRVQSRLGGGVLQLRYQR